MSADMSNIQEKQETDSEYYIHGRIMMDIASRKNFGGKTSLNIGTECGYPKEKVLETINLCRLIGGCPEQQKYYYFILKNNGQDYIISLDAENWRAVSLKKMEDMQEYTSTKLQGNMLVMANEEKVRWENLSNGENAEILWKLGADRIPPADIASMLIIEDGIVCFDNNCFITKVWFDGRQCQTQLMDGNLSNRDKSLFGIDDRIYVLMGSDIWEYDRDLKLKRRLYAPLYEEERILAVENDNGRFYFYAYAVNDEKCYRCSEEGKIYRDKLFNEIYLDFNNHIEYQMQEIMLTKDYRYLDGHVFTKDWQSEEPSFSGIALDSDKGIAAIYSQNVFIGVQSVDSQNDTLVKLDLDHGKKAAAMPVQIHE